MADKHQNCSTTTPPDLSITYDNTSTQHVAEEMGISCVVSFNEVLFLLSMRVIDAYEDEKD